MLLIGNNYSIGELPDGGYICSQCDNNFITYSSARKHMLYHSQENQAFKCENEACQSTFQYQKGLVRHMRRIHKDYVIKSSDFHIQEHKQVIVKHPEPARSKGEEVFTKDFLDLIERTTNTIIPKEEAEEGEVLTKPRKLYDESDPLYQDTAADITLTTDDNKIRELLVKEDAVKKIHDDWAEIW